MCVCVCVCVCDGSIEGVGRREDGRVGGVFCVTLVCRFQYDLVQSAV